MSIVLGDGRRPEVAELRVEVAAGLDDGGVGQTHTGTEPEIESPAGLVSYPTLRVTRVAVSPPKKATPTSPLLRCRALAACVP